MSNLTKNEEILMLAVYRLKDNAYGVSIKERINEVTGKNWNYGTLYCSLDQLVKKGLLFKKEGEPLAERGGRRKIFYSLSPDGTEALQEAHELQKALWGEIKSIAVGERR